MSNLEDTVRADLTRRAATAEPPGDLVDRVMATTVYAVPAAGGPHRRRWWWIAPALAAAAVVVTSVVVALAGTSGTRTPTGGTQLPTALATTAPLTASNSPTPASPQVTTRPPVTSPGRTTATGAWYDHLSLTPLIAGECPSGSAQADVHTVLDAADHADAVVAVQGHCTGTAGFWLAFIGDHAGTPSVLDTRVSGDGPVRALTFSSNQVTYTYDTATTIPQAGGLATFRGVATATGGTVSTSTPIDITPACESSTLGRGQLHYDPNQHFLNGIIFTGPTTPCWIPQTGFRFTGLDSSGHAVFTNWTCCSDVPPRFYVTNPSQSNAFIVEVFLGIVNDSYNPTWCVPGETTKATTLKVHFSWGADETYTIQPVFVCNASVNGGLTPGTSY